jgi:hypothetical protein
MNKEQNVSQGSQLSIIAVSQHQTGLTINMQHSHAQRERTKIMLENIRQSDELRSNRDIKNLLTHNDVAAADLNLNK